MQNKNNLHGSVTPKFPIPKGGFKVPGSDNAIQKFVGDSTPTAKSSGKFSGCAEAAIYWYQFGFNVIPIVSHSKVTAVTWEQWLSGLSPTKISTHWTKCSFHDVGFIVGDDYIVLDADSPESVAALAAIEKAHGVKPNMVVKTTKGEHHYYRRAKGTFAKSDAHSTKDHPARLDVKTSRSMVILPPSTGKIIVTCEADSASELTEVGQDFIDAVFIHNGRAAPRQAEVTPLSSDEKSPGNNLDKLKALLNSIDPDGGGYQNWLNVLMAIFHETGGSEAGFAIANEWSKNGKSYKGEKEIRVKWNSFKSGTARPITIATLFKMAKDSGADLSAINAASREQFEICDTTAVPYSRKSPAAANAETLIRTSPSLSTAAEIPFDKFSLRGMSDEIEKSVVEAKPVLDELALMGQITVWFAAANTGKTLITLSHLIEAIKDGRVDPSKVYYLNMDDSGSGLLEKLHIAEEYGFHMLAEGYRDFSAGQFLSIMRGMIENNQANGVVVILDTLKKFVDLMDKGKTSIFTNVMRPFVSKGGTVIALAHTNKNPGKDGKPVYGGVSDILNDIDCAYTIAQVSAQDGEKIVEFQNIKRRGNVVQSAAYSYCIGNGIPYSEIVLSVHAVDELQIETARQDEAVKSDAEIIGSVMACIGEGVTSKMKLAAATAMRADVSKRAVIQVIEKYTGDDPAVHKWTYSVRGRGAQVFAVLNPIPPEQSRAETDLGNITI